MEIRLLGWHLSEPDGVLLIFWLLFDQELLLWIGRMLKRIYTPAITFQHHVPVMLPLNPFKLIQNHLNSVAAAWIENMSLELDVLTMIFSATFQLGAAIVPSSLLIAEPRADLPDADWEVAARSPGLKAIT